MGRPIPMKKIGECVRIVNNKIYTKKRRKEKKNINTKVDICVNFIQTVEMI